MPRARRRTGWLLALALVPALGCDLSGGSTPEAVWGIHGTRDGWLHKPRVAAFDAEDLRVTTDGGTITVKGTVRSWAEHDEALDAAWAAPGVTSVRDEMAITY